MTEPKNKPAILLFRGRGILSALIRWQTRGEYSHAAILMEDGNIVESWQGKGVQVVRLKDWADIDAFTIPDMTKEQWDDTIDFALQQVGNKYDYLGVLRFISRAPSNENGKWFCSSLVFAALRYAGVDLFSRIEPWAVSPELLSISPLLKENV